MYFFSERLRDYAVEQFLVRAFPDTTSADEFFGIFGVGNTLQCIDRPYERFHDYEELLASIQTADPHKYRRMHKGTPFFFLAWTAFDLRNYEKALFYLDAALAEDIANNTNWRSAPGARALMLDADPRDVANRTITTLQRLLNAHLSRFQNACDALSPALGDASGFMNRFGRVFMVPEPPERRTLVSALHVFLYEFEDRCKELRFRSGSGTGSIQPMVLHLFKGGLILESLLREFYPPSKPNDPFWTLRKIFGDSQFKKDFEITGQIHTNAFYLGQVHQRINGNSIMSAFSTTAQLRNTTGHNLIRDDIFEGTQQYKDLFDQEMNAIFYVASKKL